MVGGVYRPLAATATGDVRAMGGAYRCPRLLDSGFSRFQPVPPGQVGGTRSLWPVEMYGSVLVVLFLTASVILVNYRS